MCVRMEREKAGVSGWCRRWVSVRMEWEKAGGCHPRVDQYMAACDIGCRTASVEFGSAASLLDRNESCRDSVFGSLECDQESPDLSKIH